MKLFYTTEEVATHFDILPSKVRFYISEFKLKIQTRGRNKIFSQKDIATLTKIIDLIDNQNYTLEGAKEQLKRKKVESFKNEDVINRLNEIKKTLLLMKESITK